MEKELTENEFLGMTVNERLWHAGLLNEFDEALAQKNKLKLKSILEKVHFSPKDIKFMLEELFNQKP